MKPGWEPGYKAAVGRPAEHPALLQMGILSPARAKQGSKSLGRAEDGAQSSRLLIQCSFSGTMPNSPGARVIGATAETLSAGHRQHPCGDAALSRQPAGPPTRVLLHKQPQPSAVGAWTLEQRGKRLRSSAAAPGCPSLGLGSSAALLRTRYSI